MDRYAGGDQVSTPFCPLVDAAAVFVQRKIGHYFDATWTAERLREWLEWFRHNQLWAVHKNDQGEVIGVAAGRPSTREKMTTPYHVDRDGEVLVMELIAADTAMARELVWGGIVSIVGPRRFVAYERLKYKDRGAIYPFPRFHRNVLSLPLHG